MDMVPRVSVIIPVYNAVQTLEFVLTGYSRQSMQDFEVCIADDGSGPEVRALVDSFAQQSSFLTKYIFQPDEGYRRARAINQAVQKSSSDYLIFADADCIPHRDFVRAHHDYRAARAVLCGRRVHLGSALSAKITNQYILEGRLDRLTPIRLASALLGRGDHWDEGFTLRNRMVHAWINSKRPSILGSNFSLERSLFEEVNGFNEDFVEYGGEDTELEYRLRLAGAQLLWVRHRAIQYHVFHPARSGSPMNLAVLERTRATGRVACSNGLRKI
jgi:glycosyltransferase involved in cell wall biosynthesis